MAVESQSIELIKDAIDDIQNDFDDLPHVPEETKSSVRVKFQELLEMLDIVQNKYGDEPEDNDPYGLSTDDEEA